MVLKGAAIIYLSTLIKALEHLSYAREIMLEHMIRTEKQMPEISSFEIRFEEDVQLLKKRSISNFLAVHPNFFRTMIKFDNWDEAMQFLMEHKEAAIQFWERVDDK